jgi:hypothetical protein
MKDNINVYIINFYSQIYFLHVVATICDSWPKHVGVSELFILQLIGNKFVSMRQFHIIQSVAERTPRFGSGIASGGERIVEQQCTCRFQCTPWRGWENIEPLLLRSL